MLTSDIAEKRIKELGIKHRKLTKHIFRPTKNIYRPPKISTTDQVQQYRKQERIQKLLNKQIKEIDVEIKLFRSKELVYYQGMLFSLNMNQQMIQQCFRILKRKQKYLQHGFFVNKIVEDENSFRVVRYSIGRQCTDSISRRMVSKAVHNIKSYDKVKEKESSKITKWIDHSKIRHPRISLLEAHNPEQFHKKRYSVFQDNKSKRSKTNPINSLPHQNRDSFSTLSYATPYNHSKISSELVQPKEVQTEEQSQIVFNQFYKMIKKTTNLVSVWIPPSNHPQFHSLFSYKVYKSDYNIYVLQFKKYYFLKYQLNESFFKLILDWASNTLSLRVEELFIDVDRDQYFRYFQGAGWQVRSWRKEGKFRIFFRRW